MKTSHIPWSLVEFIVWEWGQEHAQRIWPASSRLQAHRCLNWCCLLGWPSYVTGQQPAGVAATRQLYRWPTEIAACSNTPTELQFNSTSGNHFMANLSCIFFPERNPTSNPLCLSDSIACFCNSISNHLKWRRQGPKSRVKLSILGCTRKLELARSTALLRARVQLD